MSQLLLSPPFAALVPADSRSLLDSLRRAGRVSLGATALALGFCLPLSTSLSTMLITVYFVLWIVTGEWRRSSAALVKNPVALGALALFGLLALGTTYSLASGFDAVRGLGKYRELLYVSLLTSLFADPQLRRRSMTAFLAGVGVMLCLSYVEVLCHVDIGLESATDQVIFKDRIIHCLLTAFFAYMLGHQAVAEPRGRWWRLLVIGLALFNMFVFVQGRTGQMIVTLLAVLFVIQHLGFRGVIVGFVGAAVFWGVAYISFKNVRLRMADSVRQLRDQFGADKKRNKDGRLEFYELSLKIMRAHPLLGVGTAGFPQAYFEVANQHTAAPTDDPHNEYLMLGVQLGVLGPIVFLSILSAQWWYSRTLPTFERNIAQGVVVTIAAGCLVNSLIYGFTGGLFWGYFSALAFAPLSSDSASTSLPVPPTRVLDALPAARADSMPIRSISVAEPVEEYSFHGQT